MPKLTKRLVDTTKPGASDIVLWDDGITGFGLRVKPSGVKSFMVQYRNRDGRSRRVTVGRFGVVTVDEARRNAKLKLAGVTRGEDPAAEIQSMRQAPTVSELLDRYLDDHVDRHNKPKTAKEVRRIVERSVRPELGHLKVRSVTRQEVAKLHAAMQDVPVQANRVLAAVSKAFSLAELWNMRQEGTNPCKLIERYKETNRDRFLSRPELERLGCVLASADRDGTEPKSVVSAVWLLLMTGCRLNEILSLRWEFVDLENRIIKLSDSKTGPRTHVIGDDAVMFLQAAPRSGECPWVLPHTDPEKSLPDYTMEKAWRRIRKAAELPDVRLHDLRHTFGTIAGGLGLNAFIVRDMLGHRQVSTSARYVSRDADPLREASSRVSGSIVAAMRGKSETVVGSSEDTTL
jgi:integrase